MIYWPQLTRLVTYFLIRERAGFLLDSWRGCFIHSGFRSTRLFPGRSHWDLPTLFTSCSFLLVGAPVGKYALLVDLCDNVEVVWDTVLLCLFILCGLVPLSLIALAWTRLPNLGASGASRVCWVRI